jgi:glycine hydroxymethyltransferase
MVVIDLRGRAIDGIAAERRLEAHGILANRVGLPARQGDRGKAGIRIGAVAMTIRGFGPEDFRAVAAAIARLLADVEGGRDDKVARAMTALAHAHPVPPTVLMQSNAYH